MTELALTIDFQKSRLKLSLSAQKEVSQAMRKSRRKVKMGEPIARAHHSSAKIVGHVQASSFTKPTQTQRGIVVRTRQPRSGLSFHRLPFVKNLSKNNALVAQILEESYERGVAAAGGRRGLY